MSSENPAIPINQMVPVPIEEFLMTKSAPVNIFVRLSQEKFVMVAKRDSEIQIDQISTYKDKKLQYLWVDKQEYHHVSLKNLALAGMAIERSAISLVKKTHVLSAAASSVFSELDHLGLSQQTYQHARQVTDATITLVESHQNLAGIMMSLNAHSNDLLRHSMMVSVLSVGIAQKLGWRNRVTLEKLALGGLLHDIGMKALPQEIASQSLAELSHEEIQIYESHPFKGAEMLISLNVVPDDVISIVYEHHENSFGQGYPRKIRDVRINPLARVVALAQQFIHLTEKKPGSEGCRTASEAIAFIEDVLGQPFNREAFRALKKLAQHDLAGI